MWARASGNMTVEYPVPWQGTFTQNSLIQFTAAGSLIIKKRVIVMVLLWDWVYTRVRFPTLSSGLLTALTGYPEI